MGYLHINNLYKDQTILMFKECYALEKIHGTSTHISFNPANQQLRFFSGGTSHTNFVKLFNKEELLSKFLALGLQDNTVIFGEGYGGKEQGMSETYGKELKFIAFDVKIGDNWLDVPDAEQIVKNCGLEFVDYVKISTDLKEIDVERDKPSSQAKRNGILEDKIREGVVLRPLIELTKNNGERIICKHKRDEFRETKSPRPIIDPAKMEVLKNAELIANEWATNHRLEHILQKVQFVGYDCGIGVFTMSQTPEVIKLMLEDIKRESEKEIVWSKDVEKAISKLTVQLFKAKLNAQLDIHQNNP